MRLAILTAALLALLPASALGADLVVDGRGWGHGVGLSQYGAYGYALREGRDYQFILGHYYTGTTLGTAPATRMRVRLKRARAPKISGATMARATGGRRVRLSETQIYRFKALNSDRIEVINTSTGRTRARLRRARAGHRPREHDAARHGGERRAQRRLPQPDGALARRAGGAGGQQRRDRAVPVRRRAARDRRRAGRPRR